MALDVSTFETLTPSRFISFTIPNPSSSSQSLLRVAVLDSPLQPTHSPHIAAMLVPQGRETDWIFSTKSGHLQLLFASPEISRFILIGYQPHSDSDSDSDSSNHIYHRPLNCSLHHQGFDFEVWSKPLLLALSPKSLFKNGIPEIPILSYEDNLLSSIVIHRCTSSHVGEMLIEDVEIETQSETQREFRRRLRFKRMPNLIQTEVLIVLETDSSLNSLCIEDAKFIPDLHVLVHPYLAPMVASLSIISESIDGRIRNGLRPKALCLGVGGGALLTFLAIQLGFEVIGVDSDSEVLKVAKNYFGLEDSEFIHVILGDAVEYMKKLAYHGEQQSKSSFVDYEFDGFGHSVNGEVAHKFDVIMVDLDSSDVRDGISSPPLEFVRKHVLLAAKFVLSEFGILAINVISPSQSFYDNLVNHFQKVFHDLYKIDVGNGENFILIATVSPQVFSVRDCSSPFLLQLKSVIPITYINSIRKI